MTTYEPAGVAARIESFADDLPQHDPCLRMNCAECIGRDLAIRLRALAAELASVVTLDPNNPDDVQRFVEAGHRAWRGGMSGGDALRSLLPTPPLPEPNGLGAVVDESPGKADRLIRDGQSNERPWCVVGRDDRWRWEELELPTVLSHGVGCTCGGPGCPGGES